MWAKVKSKTNEYMAKVHPRHMRSIDYSISHNFFPLFP